MDVSEPAGLRQRFVHPRPCLIDVTQVRQGHGEVREHRSVGIDGQSPDGAMRWISKAHTPLQEGAGGNELPEKEAGNPVQVSDPAIAPRHRSAPRRFVRAARLAQAPACARLARDETPIGPRSAAPGTRVDRAAQPARALGRGSRPLPPPTSLSWQSVPIRARSAGPAPVAGATGRPADRPARPAPSATGRPLPPSPSAPAPADRPSANKRPPVPPARLPRSAGPTAPVAPARSPESGLRGSRRYGRADAGAGCAASVP